MQTNGATFTIAAAVSLALGSLVIGKSSPVEAQAVRVADASEGWSPPRTPWGHPDISGDFTNKFEIGTPFERPAEYEGRNLDDFTPEEIAEIAQARQELVLLNWAHQSEEGNPGGNLGGPNTWGDRFDIWRGSRPWFVVDPPDGRLPPFTAAVTERGMGAGGAGRQVFRTRIPGPEASWDEWRDQQNVSLYDRCISRGMPGSMTPVSYGNSYHILQTPDYVVIRYEMVNETRIIPLDGRPHSSSRIRTYMGSSRAHWDGDSLVIETVNQRTGFRGANPDTLKVTERFTRISPDIVEFRATIDDPETWTAPWTFAIPLTQDSSERIVEYACHEGNYSMPLRLRAGRIAELDAQRAGRPIPLREVLLDEDEQRVQDELRERRERERAIQ